MKQAQHKEDVLRSPAAVYLLMGLLGIYFISGAIYSFALGRWFPGFPPIFDVFSFVFGDGVAGAYAEGAVAALLGTACLVGVALAWRRMRSNTSFERTRGR
jgi:hypothetical protein